MFKIGGRHWLQIGYRLRTNNASTYAVYPAGVVRARKMDQLVFFCESCPRNKYSLGAGSFIYRCPPALSTAFLCAAVVDF